MECDNEKSGANPAVGLGEMAISLAGGRVIFGLVLEEQGDSFLVALPSSLTSDGSYVDGKLITATQIIRLFKSNIVFMAAPEREHRFYYFRHLLKFVETMPELFTPDRAAILKEVVAEGPGDGDGDRIKASTDPDVGDVDPAKVHPYRSTTRH